MGKHARQARPVFVRSMPAEEHPLDLSFEEGHYRPGQRDAAKGLLVEVGNAEWPGSTKIAPHADPWRKGVLTDQYRLHKVWKVRRYDAPYIKFCNDLVKVGQPQNIKRLYHGTHVGALIGILLRGLIPLGRGASMFGQGIYLGSQVKASGYGDWGENKFMFYAEVALGNTRVMDDADHNLCGENLWLEGFNSVHGKAGHTKSYAGTLGMDEWVVYGWNQVNLLYLAQFKQVKSPGK